MWKNMYSILVGKFEGTDHFSCLGVEGVGYNIRMDVRHFWCWLRTTSHPPCGSLLRSVLLVREWFRRLFADLPRRESQPDPSQSVHTFWWIKWLSDILFLLWVPEYFGCSPSPLPNYYSTNGSYSYSIHLTPRASLTLRWLMSYIYGAPILDVSRSHTTTQHSR